MNQISKKTHIIGVASCYGAQDQRCADGPKILKHLQLKEILEKQGLDIHWNKNIYPAAMPVDQASNTAVVLDICKQLARQVQNFVSIKERFVVIGGDHSCAIGTWSGAYCGMAEQDDFGLIWIDAHMDSHTTQTSPSGAIHGMPLAALLGQGDEAFYNLEKNGQKLKPHNLCLIGIRSFEEGEEKLLNKLGVRIFYMEDVQKLGLKKVLTLAKEHVCEHSQAYGISIDLDAIDPIQAPGVGSPEQNGLNGQKLAECLANMDLSEGFLGIEIAELNSDKDDDDKTARLAINIIQAALK